MDDKNNTKKILDVVKKKIEDGTINLDEMIDVSDDKVMEAKEVNLNPSSNNDKNISVDNNSLNAESGEGHNNDTDSVSNDKDNNFFNESKNIFKDGKKNNDKLKPQSKLGDKENQNKNEKKDNPIKKASENLKPALDEAKKMGNALKEKGKDAAAKAGGSAIAAATGGVVPPKLGEWASKKALNKLEKNSKKKLSKASNKIKQGLSKVKNKSSEKLQNAKQKAAKTINTTIKAVKFYRFMKKFGPIIAVAIGIIVAIAAVAGIAAVIQTYLPGLFGDVKKEVEIENYSNRDRKILEKIEVINNKYPNADGAEVMAAVSYPYYDLIRNENFGAETNPEDNEAEEESAYDKTDLLFEDDENFGSESNTGDNEEEEETKADNDMYLNIYAKKEYRDKYEELMKVYNDQGKEGYENYLKETYFENDSGYKKLLKKVESDDIAYAQEVIISDISNNSELFDKYIPEVKICNVSMHSAGTVEVDDIIKAGPENILVDVKEESCTDPSNINSCNSWEGMPIPLEEYVKGVVNTEITVTENTSMEKIKTQMIMVKSVVLGRYREMGWDVSQTETGAYVIPIRANTNDQDYCDYKVGCVGKLSGNEHGPASVAVQSMYDQAWDETVNEYIYDSKTSRTVAYYKTKYDKYCVKDKCLTSDNFDIDISNGFNYHEIIAKAFASYELINIEPEGFATVQVFGQEVCTPVNNGTGGIPDNQFIYYDQKDYDDLFCGVDGATISSHGCGVTSMAMIIANLTNESDITPIDTMYEANSIGSCGDYGTSVSYFSWAASKHQLTVETLSKDYEGAKKVIETLRNGGLVIANVNSNSPFTTGGHYIVIRKVDAEGNIYVADPNHHELFHTAYNINDFIDNNYLSSGGWVSFIGPKSPEFAFKIRPTADQGVATGYLGNPFDYQDLTEDFLHKGNSDSFPRYRSGNCHGGIDLPISVGTTIYAMDGGVVESVTDNSVNCYGRCPGNDSYGISVVINHGNGYKTVYAHLSKRLVNVGDVIAKGQLIGYSGNTGNSSGPHLHIELQNISLLAANGRNAAKCEPGKGLLKVTSYINSSNSYIGKTQ